MAYLKKLRFLIFVLLAYVVLIILIFSVESHSENANIRSISDAVWYSVVTLTTVGYGDFYPVTPAGKIIGLIFLLGSLGLLGLLISEVADRTNEFRESRKMGYQGTHFSNHIVIIGWDSFARSVALQLISVDRKVAVVTDRRDDIDVIYQEFGKRHIFVLFADLKHAALLEKVNIAKSKMIFVNLREDADKLITILNIKKAYGNQSFLVALESADLKGTFQSAGATYVISKAEIAAKLTASYIFEPDVAHFASSLLSSVKGEFECDLQQFRVTASNPYLNKAYGEVFTDLKQMYNIVLVGICKGGSEHVLIKLPEDSTRVERGDYLIMIVNSRTEKIASELFRVREGIS
jgi:voltage-gated potassium channel